MDDYCIVSGSLDTTIKLYDSFPNSNRTINFHISQVNDLQFSSDNQLLAASGYEAVVLYDFPTLQQIVGRRIGISNVPSIKFDRDNLALFAASEQKKNALKVCDISRGLKTIVSFHCNMPLTCLEYHPLMDTCLAGDLVGRLLMFDARSPIKIALHSVPHAISAISLDVVRNHVIVGDSGGRCYIFDIRRIDECLREFNVGEACVLSCRVSPEFVFISSNAGTVFVLETGEYNLCYSITDDSCTWIRDCLPIDDGRRLITTNNSCLKLWDCMTKEVISTSQPHRMSVVCLACAQY